MRKLPEFNFPAFLRAEADLRMMGHDVHNPAAVDIAAGFAWVGTTGHEDLAGMGFSLRETLAVDCELVALRSDGVCVLPGWEDSAGARAEVALAQALGLPIVALRSGPHGGCRLVELEVVVRALELLTLPLGDDVNMKEQEHA